jgi:hypothetical protein
MEMNTKDAQVSTIPTYDSQPGGFPVITSQASAAGAESVPPTRMKTGLVTDIPSATSTLRNTDMTAMEQ